MDATSSRYTILGNPGEENTKDGCYFSVKKIKDAQIREEKMDCSGNLVVI